MWSRGIPLPVSATSISTPPLCAAVIEAGKEIGLEYREDVNDLPAGAGDGHYNRQVEAKVTELGGHKGLYSTSFYTREEFARLYNGDAYAQLKQAYDPDGRLATLYDKCVGGE